MNPLPARSTIRMAALVLAGLALAGCSSSSGEASAPPTTTATPTTTTAATDETTTMAPAADGTAVDEALPSYEDAKRVYLAQADDATKASCADDEEDKDINVSSGTYTKLTCGGIARFEYIEGAENHDENWPTISNAEVYRSVFHVPGQLIVVPVGSNDDFAPNLADDCGCGEVVEQTG